MADLKKLISLYDCIAWIPTIRGALSLDLIDNSSDILGDVDKYSVKFNRYNKTNSEHYVVASSLLTVNDRKAGDDYVRTFRYIFTGHINNDELKEQDLKDYDNEEGINVIKINKDILIGHLTIITEISYILTKTEVNFLENLILLSQKNEEYRRKFAVEAVSMEQLNDLREEMFSKWKILREIINDLESPNVDEKRPTFCFDIALTRDGILFLKDKTNEENQRYYANPDSSDDYHTNTPIHRLFKVAMNYVKYIFHSNYHHNPEHDTYLPVSNLHPVKSSNSLDLDRVFKHQLDAFLTPVIKLRRGGFSDYTIDAIGIILYAKAFIEVFKHNKLVEDDITNKANVFCQILQNEVSHMTSQQKSLINTTFSQYNAIVFITGLIAFIVACLKLYTSFAIISPLDFCDLNKNNQLIIDLTVIGILSIIYCSLYYICYAHILHKQFRLKSVKKSWLYCNSSLNKQKFSCLYCLSIYINTLKIKLGKKIYNVIITILIIIALLLNFLCFYLLLVSGNQI